MGDGTSVRLGYSYCARCGTPYRLVAVEVNPPGRTWVQQPDCACEPGPTRQGWAWLHGADIRILDA